MVDPPFRSASIKQNDSQLGLSDPESGLKAIVTDLRSIAYAAIYNYRGGSSVFNSDNLWRLSCGARGYVARDFWLAVSKVAKTVHDACCGIGSELSFAHGAGMTCSGWDASEEARQQCKSLQDEGTIGKFVISEVIGPLDVMFIDIDWDDIYDRETQYLTLDKHLLLNLMSKAYQKKSKLLVIKTPKFVRGFDPIKDLCFQVWKRNLKTGYIVAKIGAAGPEFDNSLNVALRDHGFEIGWRDEDLLEMSSAIIQNREEPLKRPYDEGHRAASAETVREETLLEEDNKADFSFVIEGSEVLESAKRMELENVDLKKFKEMVDDGTVKTGIVHDTLVKYFSLPANWLELVLKFEDQLALWIKDLNPAYANQEDIDKAAAMFDFESSRIVYPVTVGNVSGKGFWYKGAFLVPHHVTNGVDVTFNGLRLKATTVDIEHDIVAYGNELRSFSPSGDNVCVPTKDTNIQGTLKSTRPNQWLFRGTPVQGLSGSPIVSGKKVVGVYSTHFLHRTCYLTCEMTAKWPSLVSEKLESSKFVSVLVPCGQGKSTWLPNELKKKFGRTILVEPRAAIVKQVAESLGREAQGFSGEESIDFSCDLLVLSHGKFLNALSRDDNCFSSYEVILVDEAHDMTSLTKASCEWVEHVWCGKNSKRGALLTGSPSSESFVEEALNQSRFPVEVETLVYPSAENARMRYINTLCQKHKGKNILIQVPTITYGEKLQNVVGLARSELINSKTLKRKSPQEISKDIASGLTKIWIATNAINFGVTIPVDVLILDGMVIESDVDEARVYGVSARPLYFTERCQWIGRVGRVKPGFVYQPKIKWAAPEMTRDEIIRLHSWRKILSIEGNTSMVSDFTREKLLTALQLNSGYLHALGLTNPDGTVVGVRNGENVGTEEKPIYTKVSPLNQSIYEVGRRTFRGPREGFDPRFEAQFCKELGLGEIHKTSLLGTIGIISAVAWFLQHVWSTGMGKVGEGYEQPSKMMPKGKDLSYVPLEPGIKILAGGLSSDEVLLNTIKTGFVDDCQVVWRSLFELVSVCKNSLFDFLYRDGITVSIRGVDIKTDWRRRTQATSVAGFMSTIGREGSYDLTGSSGLFSRDLEQFVTREGIITDQGIEALTKPDQTTSFWNWTMKTSLYCLLPSASALLMGFWSILIPIGLIYFRTAEPKSELQSRIKLALSRMMPNWDSSSFSASFVGSSTTSKTSSFSISDLIPLILLPVSIPMSLLAFLLSALSSALNEGIRFPVKVSTYFGDLDAVIKTSWLEEIKPYLNAAVLLNNFIPAATVSISIMALMSPWLSAIAGILAFSLIVTLGDKLPAWTLIYPLIALAGPLLFNGVVEYGFFLGVALGFSFKCVFFDIREAYARGKNWCFSQREDYLTHQGRVLKRGGPSGSGYCYWNAISKVVNVDPDQVRSMALSEFEKLKSSPPAHLASFFEADLEEEDLRAGGSELLAMSISSCFNRPVVYYWDEQDGSRHSATYDFKLETREDNFDVIGLYRFGGMEGFTHWETLDVVKTGLFTDFTTGVVKCFTSTNGWKVLFCQGFLCLSAYFLGIPASIMVCSFSVATWIGVGIVVNRFRVPNVIGHRISERIGKHFMYTTTVAPVDKPLFKSIPTPRMKSQNVFVIGVAGNDHWMDRALSFIEDTHELYPQDGFLIYTRVKDYERAKALLKAIRAEVVICPVDFESPAMVRSLRCAPMFTGDEMTRYRIRDIDWRVTPLEQSARVISGSVAINPLGVSVGPVLQGVVDFDGSAFAAYESGFLNTSKFWGTYGVDEAFSASLPWTYYINKLTIVEQTAMFSSAVIVNLPEGSRIMAPTIGIPAWSNRNSYVEPEFFKSVPIASYGTLSWLLNVHSVCSGDLTFCGMTLPSEVSKTSLITWFGSGLLNKVFLGAAMIGHFIGNNVCMSMFMSGLDSVKTSFIAVGSILGMLPALNNANGCKYDGEKAAREDAMFRENYTGWLNSRRARGMDGVLVPASFCKNMSNLVLVTSLLACPLPAMLGYFGGMSIGLSEPENLAYSACCLFQGNLIACVAGVGISMECLGFENSYLSNSSDMLLAMSDVMKTNVDLYGWNPRRRLLGSVVHPLEGLNPNQWESEMWFKPRTRGFTYSWGGPSRYPSLPVGMINLRASSLMAMHDMNLFDFRKPSSALVIGSGIGGLAQGLLQSGFKNLLTLETLNEEGFQTNIDLARECHLKCKGFEDLRVDSFSKFDKHSLVILDVMRLPNDPYIVSDDFSHRDEIESFERDMTTHAIKRTLVGGSTIVSVSLDNYLRCSETIDYFVLSFSSVKVMVDPYPSGPQFVWIIGMGRKSALPEHPVGNLEFKHSLDVPFYISSLLADDWFNLYSNFELSGSEWLSKLHKTFKRSITSASVSMPRVNYDWFSSNVRQPLLDFEIDSPVEYWQPFTHSVYQVVQSDVRYHEGYDILGSLLKSPVQDRQFNTGIDRVAQAVLAETGALPLEKCFNVPSQTNFHVSSGLAKRYDYVSIEPDSCILSAFDFLENLVSESAKGYDFEPPSWNDLSIDVNKASSMGYLSDLSYKNVGDALRNGVDDLDVYYDRLINGGPVNHVFHASPKVERKEAVDNFEVQIPRLFLYKCGETRLCEMRLFKRVNDFFGASGKLSCSMKGDIFDKANRIVTAFERYVKPGAVSLESTKFDGHKEAELLIGARRVMAKACAAGDNGSNASKVMLSTIVQDTWGYLVTCGGEFVRMKRANQKSGLWDTSINNKIANFACALSLIRKATKWSYAKILRDVEILIEGDDGLIVCEEEVAYEILKCRNAHYASLGLPQRGAATLATSPESSSFCSHGATRINQSTCVPVRDMSEVLGRWIIPNSNNSFDLDNVAAARSLTSTISLVAQYWYLPQAQDLWRCVREIIPKTVIAKSVSPTDRWKFVYNLGDLDPTSFELTSYLEKRFTDVTVLLNDRAKIALNVGQFGNTRILTSANVVESLKSLFAPVQSVETIWYSCGVSFEELESDLNYLTSLSKNFKIVFETSAQLRDVLMKTRFKASCQYSWSSMPAVIGMSKIGLLTLVFSEHDKLEAQLSRNVWTMDKCKHRGFRGDQINFVTVGEQFSRIKKTSFETAAYDFLLEIWPIVKPLLPCVLLAVGIKLFETISRTVSYALRSFKTSSPSGNPVFPQGGIVTNRAQAERFVKAAGRPVFNVVPTPIRALSIRNLSEPNYAFDDKTTKETLKWLIDHHRKFVMVKFDSRGDFSMMLFHQKRNPISLGKLPWVVNFRKWLFSKYPAEKIDDVSKWTYSGSLINLKEWNESEHYSRLLEFQEVFETMRGSMKNVSFFVRMDDTPLIPIGDMLNPYLSLPVKWTPPKIVTPVFGEANSSLFRDLAKPCDADRSNSNNNYFIWKIKMNRVLFVGGCTGSGSSVDSNMRLQLVSRAQEILETCDMKLDFHFTREKKRFTRDLSGGFHGPIKVPICAEYPYHQQSMFKFIVVVEGYELADRVLKSLETGSLIIILKPKYCVTESTWCSHMLKSWHNCVITDIDQLGVTLLKLKNNDVRAKEIAAEGQILASRLLDVDNQSLYMLSTLSSILNLGGKCSSVEDVVSWIPEFRGQHSAIYKDLNTDFVHGTALNLKAASTTYNKIVCDIGCGLTIFELDLHCLFDVSLALDSIKRASDIYDNLDHLNEEELSELSQIIVNESDKFEIGRAMGTLGGGNHFLEIQSNQTKTVLVVHSGSRNASQVLLRNFEPTQPVNFEVVVEVSEISGRIASLNRRVMGRMLGLTEIIGEFVHTRVVTIPGLGVSLLKNMYSGYQSVWFLGSSGTGGALLDANGTIVPHGTGGGGRKAAPLRGINPDRWFHACGTSSNFKLIA